MNFRQEKVNLCRKDTKESYVYMERGGQDDGAGA